MDIDTAVMNMLRGQRNLRREDVPELVKDFINKVGAEFEECRIAGECPKCHKSGQCGKWRWTYQKDGSKHGSIKWQPHMILKKAFAIEFDRYLQ